MLVVCKLIACKMLNSLGPCTKQPPIFSLVACYKHHVVCENALIHPALDVNSSIMVPCLCVNMIMANQL
jgi:hypothetical protein